MTEVARYHYGTSTPQPSFSASTILGSNLLPLPLRRRVCLCIAKVFIICRSFYSKVCVPAHLRGCFSIQKRVFLGYLKLPQVCQVFQTTLRETPCLCGSGALE